MRFMPMGRPIRPRPMSPICFAAGFKRDLPDVGGRCVRALSQRKEIIVAEFGQDKASGKFWESSGGLGAMIHREDTGTSAGRSSYHQGGTAGFALGIRDQGRLGSRCGLHGNGGRIGRSAGVRLFFDANQTLVGNFPAEVTVFAASKKRD